MHSHVKGEKLDNISRTNKVGFEADRELEFLPSYFEDPHNASLADTLYISVVIKGIASFVFDRDEKTLALNGLMEKYQPEGQYDTIQSDMRVLDAVSIIKVTPQTLHGKYKIGQHMRSDDRMNLARKILKKNYQIGSSIIFKPDSVTSNPIIFKVSSAVGEFFLRIFRARFILSSDLMC